MNLWPEDDDDTRRLRKDGASFRFGGRRAPAGQPTHGDSVNEKIAALVELQNIDDEIREYQVQRDELAANLERLRSILGRMGEGLADKRERLAEATRFHEEKRIDLSADADRLSGAKSKLAAVTRTKEYAAMTRELENLRKKFGDDESELRRLETAITEYKASIAEEEAKLEELSAEVSREEQSSADRLTELDTVIARIGARKKSVSAVLPKSLVGRYERILVKREGKAVVPVVAGHCQGCRMMLPPQLFIQVQRGEALHSCPSCQRYLYYTAEIAAAEAS